MASVDLERALGLLGPLERRLMRAVWTGAVPAPFSGRQILAKTPELAYTTVTTTLNRLVDKGLLYAESDTGPRPFTYWPTGTPSDFLAEASAREALSVVDRYGEAALAAFAAQLEALPSDVRRRLEQLGHQP